MLNKLTTVTKRFSSDISGNLGIMFSLLAPVILLGVGAALDYSLASQKEQRYQSLADMAVLAAAVSGLTEENELQALVVEAINAQSDDVGNIDFEFFGNQNKDLRVTVTGEHPLVLMNLFGQEDLQIEAISESLNAKTGVHINLAMVLDSTLSMEGSRIDALKEASEDLLTFLEEAAATPEAVHVSVVPFSDYVRISTTYENATWLNLQSGGPVTWQRLDEENSTGCVTVGESNQVKCEIEVFEDVTQTFDWHGCMVSRPDDFHFVPAFDSRRLQGSKHSNRCNASYNQLIPMSTDLEAANTAIQNITPIGDTYMPAGLIWGWRTLDRNLPFDELASTPATDVRNIMMIMTDGENSVSLSGTKPDFEGINHWGIYNAAEGENRDVANTLTETLCTDIKASGIEIISIAYDVTDPSTIDLLSGCASSGSFFYNAQSAAELKSAFSDVGESIGTGEIRLIR